MGFIKESTAREETYRNSKYVDDARPVINRIIEEQALTVDAITGTTTTSK